MDREIFAQLQQGATFDRRRFKKEIDLFEKEGRAPGALPAPAAAEPPSGEAGGPAEEPAAAEQPPPCKKRKTKGQQQQQPPGAGALAATGIALFSGQQQQQEQKAGAVGAAQEGEQGFTDDTPEVNTHDPFEEANVIRKSHKIKVAGSAPPAPLRSFAELAEPRHGAPRRLLSNLLEGGFHEPTPIQRQAVTALLARRELLAIAPTGSGKTLAFLLPLVIHCRALRAAAPEEAGVKGVVLNPTKELMMQSGRVLKQLLPGLGLRASILTKATAAGTDFGKVDILLANPLRLGAMAGEGKLDLSAVRTLILDEADKLFGMGFTEQIDAVLAACTHKDIVRGLFSATLPEQVEGLARSVLQDPLRVTVGERNTAAATVAQRLLFVGRESGKLLALRQLIGEGLKPPVLVFVATKERAKELHRELMYDGVHVDSIHADQSQAARQAAVDNFRLGRTWVLVATDLIGRGMDFLGVNTVINYDFPNSTTDYIHRVGRTGRAGRAGESITFFMEDDAGQLRSIANVMRTAGCEVPEWMLQLKKERRRRAAKPPAAGGISTEPRPERPAKGGKRRREGGEEGGQGRKATGGGGGRGKAPGPKEGGRAGKKRPAAGGGGGRQGGRPDKPPKAAGGAGPRAGKAGGKKKAAKGSSGKAKQAAA